jgi:hypothetical protein
LHGLEFFSDSLNRIGGLISNNLNSSLTFFNVSHKVQEGQSLSKNIPYGIFMA